MRTAYMQYLMKSTYPQVGVIAIQTGTLEGAWEKAIADRLLVDCYNDQNPQAFAILEMTGDKEYTKETFLKAAKIILNTKLVTDELPASA